MMQSFKLFAGIHERKYKEGSEEYATRLKYYTRAHYAVLDHNRKVGRRWNATLNEFSDWSDAELKQLRGYVRDMHYSGQSSFRSFRKDTRSLAEKVPAEFSWTNLNAVRSVRNQGICGSCWAISTASVLQAHSEILGVNRTFSTQELVSCVPNPNHCGGTGGCNGATAELALAFTMKYGLSTVDEVPYKAQDSFCPKLAAERMTTQLFSGDDNDDVKDAMTGTSAFGLHKSVLHDLGRAFRMQSWERLPANDGFSLMTALTKDGPTVSSVAATNWVNYDAGIFDHCDNVVDHAVVLVGYGTDAKLKEPYWLIQNSWGPHWGENGFVRLLRHSDMADEPCGIDYRPEDGLACIGGPTEVEVCGECGIFFDSALPHFA
jgi:cathepsin L